MMHPVKNESSKDHYENTITELEKILSVHEMHGACKFNIYKYKSRLGKKTLLKGLILQVMELYYIHRPDQFEAFKIDHLNEVMDSDLKKIATYENYVDVLVELIAKGHGDEFVTNALKKRRDSL